VNASACRSDVEHSGIRSEGLARRAKQREDDAMSQSGIEIDFDVHVPLDSLQGPTSKHNFLRNFEIVVEIDGEKHIAGGEASHFFPCPAGKSRISARVRSRSGIRPEWMLEGHATLFADAEVTVVADRSTRIRYVGDSGWFLTGKGSFEAA
jgi:hypothetical protein